MEQGQEITDAPPAFMLQYSPSVNAYAAQSNNASEFRLIWFAIILIWIWMEPSLNHTYVMKRLSFLTKSHQIAGDANGEILFKVQ